MHIHVVRTIPPQGERKDAENSPYSIFEDSAGCCNDDSRGTWWERPMGKLAGDFDIRSHRKMQAGHDEYCACHLCRTAVVRCAAL